MEKASSLRTPIKRARGLGAAHSGTHHFWLQRVSALALIPLSIWFMVELALRLREANRTTVELWLQNPFSALAFAVLIVALFTHARLGVQVIIEDYIQREGKKIAALLLLNTCIYVFGAASLMAIVKMHF